MVRCFDAVEKEIFGLVVRLMPQDYKS